MPAVPLSCLERRMSGIASLVEDAPPGEIDAVRTDIEVFSGGNSSISRALEEKIAEANVAQLQIVTVDGKRTVLSRHNQIDETTFFTHGASPVEFTVDHTTRQGSSKGEHEILDSSDIAEAQRLVSEYANKHYTEDSVAAAFLKGSNFVVVIIGRKLSPTNFHNGQFKAEYVWDGDELEGEIVVDVHYFEEGNVRMKSSKSVKHELKSVDSLSSVLATVEHEFEAELNETLVKLNEREFKALRRQLPITRQPMMWGKAVAGYKLGKELENR